MMNNKELEQLKEWLEKEYKSKEKPCPSCGRCPTCGRSNTSPQYPWQSWPNPWITWTSTNISLQDSSCTTPKL